MSTVTASVRMTELAAIVGDQHVIEAPTKLSAFAIDGIAPAISVSPGSVEEVSAVLRYAFERELVVVPAGGMVHQEIGNAPAQVDVLLRTERLTAIEHYDPGDLTIGVGAGTNLGDLQGLLRDQGQLFPLDIAHADRVTIGGAMAVAAHGPHKHFFGGLRDYCIGVRFVTADGVVAKGGGRVVKNVAGFDLMKLMIGSYGTLGVITSASFKLFPRPVQTRTFICEFVTLAEAMACRDRVIASPLSPICLELLSPGSAGSKSWTIAIRAGGTDRVLARYASEMGSQVTRTLDGAGEQQLWADVELLGEHAPVKVSLSIPSQSALEVLQAVGRTCAENHLAYSASGRVGIGSLLLAFDSGMAENYVAAAAAIRKAVPRDASVVVTRCPSALKPAINVWGASPTNLQAMAGVKLALNPKDTLNRGRFLL
jgi:glycolate oxidase FAD binding subunit